MNAMGVISGVGADTHVIKVFTHAFGEEEGNVDYLLSHLPTELAINVNDFIGEIGQQLGQPSGDKDWVAMVFLMMENHLKCADIIGAWRAAYE